MIASSRIIDRQLLNRTIGEIDLCAGRGDQSRAIELLSHIVPEYRGEPKGREGPSVTRSR